MEVRLNADQQALVEHVVASGRLEGEDEVAQEAFALCEERERRRMEIISGLDAGELDIASGLYTDYTDLTLPDMSADLKREAREFRSASAGR